MAVYVTTTRVTESSASMALTNCIGQIGHCLPLGMCASNRNSTHTLRRRHNGRDNVSNHQPHHCLLNRLFRRRSKKTSKLRVTGLCVGNSPGTGEFLAQMASNAENVSIWWRHHELVYLCIVDCIGMNTTNDCLTMGPLTSTKPCTRAWGNKPPSARWFLR